MPRRGLSFTDLAEIMPDVIELTRVEHDRIGRWSLGQICDHLARSFESSMDGFDLRRHRFKRWFLRKAMLRYALARGIPQGTEVDPGILPPGHVDLDEAVLKLEKALNRYRAHTGLLCVHPLFGRLSREVWDRFHCLHAAHHLSFLVPRTRANSSGVKAGMDGR